jgi:hypothetical protein
VLLLHQTEEWVWPGGFLPWVNRTVLGSDAADRPITRRIGFVVNVGLGWGISVIAPVVADEAPWVMGANVGLMVGNVVMHSSAAVRQRRYNPGLVTAVLLFGPAIAVNWRGIDDLTPRERRYSRLAILAGLANSAVTFAALRRRARSQLPAI